MLIGLGEAVREKPCVLVYVGLVVVLRDIVVDDVCELEMVVGADELCVVLVSIGVVCWVVVVFPLELVLSENWLVVVLLAGCVVVLFVVLIVMLLVVLLLTELVAAGVRSISTITPGSANVVPKYAKEPVGSISAVPIDSCPGFNGIVSTGVKEDRSTFTMLSGTLNWLTAR
jgi:hypothetical protein